MSHTPGPWVIDFASERIYGTDGFGEHQVVVYETNTNEEDIRLIAAAPELLDALRPFANFACDEPCECNNCKARVVIAKATQP